MVHMWKSEDSSEYSLSPSLWVPGIRLKSSSLVTSTFTHWAIVPANFGFLG